MESIIIIVGLLEFRSFMSIALGMPVLPNTQNMSLWLNKSDEPEYKRRNVGKGADLHTFFSQENTPLWTSLYFVRVSKVKCIQGSLNIAVLRPKRVHTRKHKHAAGRVSLLVSTNQLRSIRADHSFCACPQESSYHVDWLQAWTPCFASHELWCHVKPAVYTRAHLTRDVNVSPLHGLLDYEQARLAQTRSTNFVLEGTT